MEFWQSEVVGSLQKALEYLHGLLVTAGLGPLSWGLTIILFTVIIKTITLPLTLQQIRSSRAMQELQPQLKALQKQYGKDRERLMQEQMRLYKENKINPAAGCLPLLIQMPVWFGLYQALFALAQSADFANGATFLWLNLAAPEPFPQVLAVLTGVTQWVVTRMMTPRTTDPQQQMMNQMMQFMPIMFIFFAFQVPSGLVLYWVTSNVYSIVQQYLMMGWGSLLPLPFIGGGAAALKEVKNVAEPSTNGRSHPKDVERPQIHAGPHKVVAEQAAIERGPGGGKKRRIKRR